MSAATGDDPELIAAAKTGDRAAIESLLRTHYDNIYAVCYRMLGNAADAEDAAQNTLMSITRRIESFDGRAAFGTWAYRIATNASLDEIRRRKRHAEPGLSEIERADDDMVHRAKVRSIDEVETSDEIQRALDRLPEIFRAPVVLRDLFGYDYAEIGRILEIAAGTVRSRIARGRQMLREHLGNQRPTADVKVDDHE